jgi:hypothetical protein
VEGELFDEAADVLRSLLSTSFGDLRMRPRRYGLKVWFGTGEAAKEHYEAQVVGPRQVPAAKVLALEIGFHAEHPKPVDNERALDALVAEEKQWRRTLGSEPVAGPFLGRATWRRLSETWIDPDLSDDDLAVEVGTRLYDYITALEPLRGAS